MIYGVRVKTGWPLTDEAREPVALRRVPLPGSLTPPAVLRVLQGEQMPFALTGSWAGGGAILGANPVAVTGGDATSAGARADGVDPFGVLDRLPPLLGDRRAPREAVGGGWFGWLGYRLAGLVERVAKGPARPVPMPDFHLAYYDHVLRLDAAGRWWFEALVSPDRDRALQLRLDELRERLAAVPRTFAAALEPGPLRLSSDGAEAHLQAVARARERIHAGEIFQANLCLRLEGDCDGRATDVFGAALSRVSPAYGAAFDTPDGGIASLSPELFLRRRGPDVVTGPIKGTIKREPNPEAAAAALVALLASAKDAAEHVMIVDLMRNDLGRVCAYGSVRAPREPSAEAHPGLWHLVSRVSGRLRPNVGNAELLRATFPPGSVTGAPKVQSLRVIAELEHAGREVYTGAIGFCSPLAGLELSVAIRTLELSQRRLWLGAGGGIVADSEPRHELEEALVKARPIAAAIGSSVIVESSSSRRGARAA